MRLRPSPSSRTLAALALLLIVALPVPAQDDAEEAAPEAAPTTAADPDQGPPVMMSTDWAASACAAWNENETLTTGLATWIENDADRGFKILRLYRTDCPDSPWVELKISGIEGEARCTYGGALGTDELAGDSDYVMHAQTQRWIELGEGQYGPMKAMMFGRLKFSGPMWEAMKNMGPFGSFLELVGAVASDTTTCAAAAETESGAPSSEPPQAPDRL